MGHAPIFGLPSAVVSFAIFRMLGLPHPTIATLLTKYDADVKSDESPRKDGWRERIKPGPCSREFEKAEE